MGDCLATIDMGTKVGAGRAAVPLGGQLGPPFGGSKGPHLSNTMSPGPRPIPVYRVQSFPTGVA